MPMVYEPGPGDLINFQDKKGMLVKAWATDCLTFIVINDNGETYPLPGAMNQELDHFKDAVVIDTKLSQTKIFKAVANAIFKSMAASTHSLEKSPY